MKPHIDVQARATGTWVHCALVALGLGGWACGPTAGTGASPADGGTPDATPADASVGTCASWAVDFDACVKAGGTGATCVPEAPRALDPWKACCSPTTWPRMCDVLCAHADSRCPNVPACEFGSVCPCGIPRPPPPTCKQLAPAPTSSAQISTFIQESAIPLLCTEGTTTRWDFDPLIERLEGKRVVFFGEIHGTHELAHISRELLVALARTSGVDAVALEAGIDLTEPFNEYVRTGKGPLVDVYGLGDTSCDNYHKALVEGARALYLQGRQVTLFGVDAPWRLAYVNEQIKALAAQLGAAAQRLLLESLPEPKGLSDVIDAQYEAKTKSYWDGINANRQAICNGVALELCQRIVRLARALWVGAHFAAGELTLEAFLEREQLMYESFLERLPESTLIYAHMGAGHAAKSLMPSWGHNFEVAAMLNVNHPPTVGRVFSLAVAYDRATIKYGSELLEEPPWPTLIADALGSSAVSSYLVLTGAPDSHCADNPLKGLIDSTTGAIYAELYDALFYLQELTPRGWSTCK